MLYLLKYQTSFLNKKEDIMIKVTEIIRDLLLKITGADKTIAEYRESACRYQSELVSIADAANHKTAIIVRYQDKCAYMQERINWLEDEIIRRDRVCAEIEDYNERINNLDTQISKHRRVLH